MDNLAQTPGTGGPLGQMESDGPPGSKGTASSGGPQVQEDLLIVGVHQ